MVLCIDTVQRSLWSDFRFSYCLTWVTLVHIQETSMYIISISCPIQCFTSEPWSPLYRVFIISDPITRCFMLFCNIPIGLMELPKVPKNSSMVSYIYDRSGKFFLEWNLGFLHHASIIFLQIIYIRLFVIKHTITRHIIYTYSIILQRLLKCFIPLKMFIIRVELQTLIWGKSVISTTIKWIIHFFKQVSIIKVMILNTTIRGP